MRFIITLLFIFSGIKAYEQNQKKEQKKDSVAPVAFDYARDFKAIVEKSKDATSNFYYHKLLPRYLNLDSTISRQETLALMIGYTEDPRFKPWKDFEKEKEIFDLNDSGNYDESLAESKIYLDTHPFSLRILKERSYAYHQLRNEDSANYFMDMVERVMGAMIYSGKGKTPETPIFSLGLADGEYFIPNVGMTVSNKTTAWNKYNHFVEVIDAMNEMGEHIKYYFVIQHAKNKIDDDEVNDAKDKKPKKSKKKDTKETKDKDAKSNNEKEKDSKGKKSKDKDRWNTDASASDSIPPGH